MNNQAGFSFDLPIRTSHKRKQADIADVFEDTTGVPSSKKVHQETGEDEWQREMMSLRHDIKKSRKAFASELSPEHEAARKYKQDQALAQIKQLIELRRTEEGERKFQEQCKANRERLEKDEREKEEREKEEAKKAEEKAKEAEKARRLPPKAFTFGFGHQKDSNLAQKQRGTRRAIRSFVGTLELVMTLKDCLSKIREDSTIQSEATTNEMGHISG